ncbi:MAG: host specificity protein J [Marivivens sp.]|nr:host specificity protein J [Marivivens sp.]
MALNSTSVIKIVDLLCEGPIAGIVGTEEGIYLDETPIRTGSSRNFDSADVSYDFKPGGRTQSQLEQGNNGTSTVNNINTEIGENYSETLNANNEVIARDYGSGQLIRQITDTDVESFELLFSIPRMFSTAQEGLAKGQLFNGVIRIVVDVQAQGQAFNTVPLANGRGNRIFWTSLIEIQSLRTAYPYCAVAGLSVSTRQFASLPTRAYKIRGRIVQIPSNAFARSDGSLSFSGAFNGSLKSAWTTCPVSCWYDMLVNPRYGAGDFVQAENVSWVDLYPLAQYANQLVTNSDGSVEPRFACNAVIGNQAEAFNVLQDLASVFRGMLYWQANTIQATADHGNLNGSDLSPVHLYTNSNVIAGAFNYSGTSLKTRSTSIRVRYNDPENFYKSNYVVVEDADLISRYGYQFKEVVAFGATSKFQAQRLGRWMLASEEIDGEIVTFTTGLQGAVVLPGQIFAVSDEMRQSVRLAGRVSSATTSQITVDQTISLPAGSGHQLTCTLADGSIETKSIVSVSGAVITTSSFSSAPLTQSVWSISSSSVAEQKFRCLSVGDSGDGQYTITGVEHNDSIYATADVGTPLQFFWL